MARAFTSHLTYRETPTASQQKYDLQVNHPLTVGDTEVFLIGHGYAPVITIRDGDGEVAYSGPTIFLPTDQTFRSFGVVKAPDAEPIQIGARASSIRRTRSPKETGPFSAFGNAADFGDLDARLATGDLGMDDGTPQSVYALDKSRTNLLKKPDGSMFRVDLSPGSVDLPNGLGSVSFDGVERWNKIQISQTPGKEIALAGVVLALLGLLGSLFIRPDGSGCVPVRTGTAHWSRWPRSTVPGAGTLRRHRRHRGHPGAPSKEKS